MPFLKRSLDFLLFSNLYIAFCALSMCLVSQVLAGGAWDLNPLALQRQGLPNYYYLGFLDGMMLIQGLLLFIFI